jgi:hypothetical protein
MKKYHVLNVVLVIVVVFFITAAANAKNAGGKFIATGDDIVVTCGKDHPGHDKEIIVQVEGQPEQHLFWSKDAGRVSIVKAPHQGAEVTFKMKVKNTEHTYSSGGTEMNPDDMEHVESSVSEDGTVDVGFEELYKGGDLDFADSTFNVSGVEVDGGFPTDQVVAYHREEAPEQNDCSLPDIEWTEMNFKNLQFRAVSDDKIRIVLKGGAGNADWYSNLENGEYTVTTIFNDRCDLTLEGKDEVEYFEVAKKNFKGYRLVDYDYPDADQEYAGKIRVTVERGIRMVYVYYNNVPVRFQEMIGNYTTVRIMLHDKDGNLVVAAHANGTTMSFYTNR